MRAEQGKITSVECARGVAAMLVVLVHAGSFISWPKFYGERPLAGAFDWCHAGVDFFFVLSGFIIAYVHWNDIDNPAALPRYAWRRGSRIYPPYWAIMALVVPMYFLSPTVTRYEQQPDIIVMSWFLLLTPDNKTLYPIAWSLVHEVFFYVVFAVLVVSRRVGAVLGGGLLVGTLIYQGLAHGQFITRHYLPDFALNLYNFQFLGGFLAAAWLRYRRVPSPLAVLALGIAVFVGTGMVEVYTSYLGNHDLRKLGYGLGAVLILLGLVQSERAGLLRVPRLLARVGSTSYSIYLVHVLALTFIAKGFELAGLRDVFGQTQAYAMFVVLAVCAGVAFGFTVEHPLQRLTRRMPLAARAT